MSMKFMLRVISGRVDCYEKQELLDRVPKQELGNQRMGVV